MLFKKIKNAETNANFASGSDIQSDEDAAKVKVIDYTADFEIYLVSLLLTQNCTTQVKQKMI